MRQRLCECCDERTVFVACHTMSDEHKLRGICSAMVVSVVEALAVGILDFLLHTARSKVSPDAECNKDFPLIAGSGTLTTLISLTANYSYTPLLIGIGINLVIVYIVLKSLRYIAKLLGPAGLIAIRKFFGVILLAIAVKIFTSNVGGLIK